MFDILKELGDESRRLILGELRTGPKRVTDLVAATNLKQPNVSNHLARLREKGFLKSSKIGREVYYSFADQEALNAVCLAFSRPHVHSPETCFRALSRAYAAAALEGDEQACCDIACELVRKDTPLLCVYSQVIAPAMFHIGDCYSDHMIDEAAEHAATAITERIMARMVQFYLPLTTNGRTAVLGCASGNRHCLGLRMASDLLQTQGWKPVFLGADVPLRAFESAVERHKPEAILISCATEAAMPASLELIHELASRKQASCLLAVGGLAAGDHREQFLNAGADKVLASLSEFACEFLNSEKPLQAVTS